MTKLLTTRWGVGINSVTGAARRGLCIGLLSALTLCTLAPQAQAAAEKYCTKSVMANLRGVNGISGACLWVKADKGVDETVTPITWVNQVDPYFGDPAGDRKLTGRWPQSPLWDTSTAGGLNFNPAMRFNGVDQAIGRNTPTIGTIISPTVTVPVDAISVFFVSREEGRKDATVFSHDVAGDGNKAGRPVRVYASWPKSDGTLYWQFGPSDSPNRISVTAPFKSGVPNLGLVTSTSAAGANNLAIFVNAKELAKGGTGVQINDIFTLNATLVGSSKPGTDGYRGIIPELLEFNHELSDVERERVQSYLALKYGLTLYWDGVGRAYISGYGERERLDVYSHKDKNGNLDRLYWNGIFGIGRDSITTLDQRVSQSMQRLDGDKLVPGDSPLIIATGPNFTLPNGYPRRELADGTYLVLGDNDGKLEMSAPTATQRGRRLARVWHARTNNTTEGIKDIYLGFDPDPHYHLGLNLFEGKPGWLYVSTDPEFGIGSHIDRYRVEAIPVDGRVFYTPVRNRGDTTPMPITIKDSSYLTLAQEPESVCSGGHAAGVADACLWLKADDAGTLGPAVTTWQDRSGNVKPLGADPAAGYHAPELITGSALGNMNFNPVVRFNGTDQALMRNDSTLGPNGNEINLFFVNRTKTRTDTETFTHTDAADPRLTLSWDNSKGSKHRWFNGPSGRFIDVPSPSIGVPHLGLVRGDTTGAGSFSVNAKSLGTLGAGAAANKLSVTRLGHGTGTENPGYHDGDIAELIEFKRDLKPDERTRVQSYLALKYGLTLDRTELDGNAYKRSDGTSVYDNSNYWHRIFGLGNDSATGLNQRVAKSQEDGAVLTITTANPDGSDTADFTSANSTSRTPLPTAGQYLVLGDNGDGKPLTLDSTKRLQRRWFAQNTGGVNSVYLGFDVAALDTVFPQDSSSYLEVVQEDNSSKKRYALGRVQQDSRTFLTPVDPVSGKPTPVTPIPDRAYIALGKACDGKALGIADACVWLKADTGLGAGNNWEDKSGMSNDATATQTPTLVPNALNFNPAVSYSGGAGHTLPESANVTNQYTFFGVARMAGTKNARVFSSAINNRLFGYHDNGQDKWYDESATGASGSDWKYPPGNVGNEPAQTRPMLYTLKRAGNIATFKSNGRTLLADTPIDASGAYRVSLANGGAYDKEFSNVSIPEFFSFNRPLKDAETNRIESYLALKYGLTLGTAAAPVNYVNGAGAAVWDGTTGYPNRIFGLGNDSDTKLNQRVAKSQEDGAVLTIATTADFTSANSGRTTQLAAGQYLVLGDNGKPLTLDSTQRLQRVWRAQSTGGPIPVFLGLDAAALDPTNPAGKRMLWVEGGAGADGSFPTGRTTPYELSNTLVTGYWVPVENGTPKAKAVPIPNGVSFLTYGVLSFPKISLSVKSKGGVGTFGLSSVDAATNGFKPSSATTKDLGVAVAAEPATQTLIKEGEVTITVAAVPPSTNWSLESVSCTDAANPGSAVSTKRDGNHQFTILADYVKMGSDLRCTLTTKYVAPIPPAQLPKLRLSVQSTGGVGTFGLSGDHNFGTDTATTAKEMVPIDLAEKTLDAVDVPVTITVAMPAANWSLDSVRCTANPEVPLTLNGNQFIIPAAHVKAGSNLHCTITTKYAAPPASGVILPKLSLSVQSRGDTGTFRFGGTNGFGEVIVTTTKEMEPTPTKPAVKTLSKADEAVTITATMPAANWSLESVSCTDATNPGSAVSTKRNGNQFTIDAAGVKTGSDLRCALTTKYVAPIPPAQLPKLRLSVKNIASDTGKFEFSGTNGFQPIATTTIKSGESVDLATQTLSKDGEDVRITVTMLGTAAMPATNWSLESVSCTDAANPGSAVSTKRDGNQFTILADYVKAGSDLRCALVARYDSGSTLKTISGRVFVDNGAGGGVANDGKINGGEAGRSGVALRLTNCNGTTHAATSSSGDGSYRLLVPSSITGGDMCVAQTLSDDYRVTQGGVEASGVEASGVTLDTTAAQRNRWRFNYTGASVQNLHIGNVPSSRLLLDGWGRGMVGDTVDFPHRFIAGTDGTLTFEVINASSTISGWSETLYRDVNCDAKFDAGAALLGDSLTVKADENVCVIVRQLFVPAGPYEVAGPYEGATRQFQLQAVLTWKDKNNADVSEPLTNRDHTTVGEQPLRLYKQVRNVNTGEPWTTRNSAKPGEILEYCITFTNQAPEKIDDLVISGATPNYTTLVSAGCPTNQPTTTVTTGCPDVLPAGMGCTVTKPVVGGTGSLRWQFTGPLRPRAEGAVTYQVKVNDK